VRQPVPPGWCTAQQKVDGPTIAHYRHRNAGFSIHLHGLWAKIALMIPAYSLLSAAACGAAAIALCVNARRLCVALGLMDMPDERKVHRNETPLMGGIALLGAFAPVAAALILGGAPVEKVSSLLIWLAAVVAMALLGLADDRHSLAARDRLLVSFLVFGSAAIIDPVFNVRALDFAHPKFVLGLWTNGVAYFFTTLCCVGLVNAVNMADGKNGLVIGLCLGWLGLLALRAPGFMLPVMALLAILLLVLFAFNLRGRLFLGDGGAYGLACAVGLLAIAIYNTPGAHAGRAISADELVLLFVVPVIDSFRLTFVRWRRGQSPMAADRDHLHHHLQSRFGWPGGLIVYFILAFSPILIW
jgi:UDP-GlcNAc:undecaprenyl-phosphate GlcNAc-1-phosphate transferase